MKKESFIKSLKKVQPYKDDMPETQTKGFNYLHSIISKTVFDGKFIKIESIDFDKFTMEDLEVYNGYYNDIIDKKLDVLKKFTSALHKAASVFTDSGRYY